MIKILETKTIFDGGDVAIHRHAEITIDGYRWRVGGLPLEGNLQAILEANEARLLAAAQAAGEPVDSGEVDFADFVDRATSEIAWLEATIPNIDTMTAAEVRAVVKRLAQENVEVIRSLRYLARRLGK